MVKRKFEDEDQTLREGQSGFATMNNNSYWKQEGESENGTLEDDGVDVTKVAQAAQAAGAVEADADADESTDSANMAAVVAAATAATAAAQAGGAEPEEPQQVVQTGEAEVDASLLPLRVNNRGRPLQTTKRAAQNRAAQRAFRQRKEQYIKELESEVKESKESLDELEKNYHQLREYAIKLSYRLSKDGDLPEPPACIANDVAQSS
ncbi:hypothetical protein B0I72DRAFT_139832 [Yarrowia lipolytica]|uniref:Putative transcription factor kapC n=2 Tax=Yarrowia lipolytica TaxID=4952 RepID=Q6C9W7_YARLI|nr:YALI0D07744p [Yarrowia lipolytica CLIB122]KAB8284345.1 hypothetical protein BKA91DRAFT_135194 [Yarrowia lipolytica]KAE8172679.1 hypothetical protein BKA90DRAFT_137076 [Yarrowia lipolytica]KAJ8054662.1 hypothetical protein LXG23DRAFT_56218 [Yarrowia lipolytica]QNP98516.1 Hypothetical protein YALI2_D00957g [Yarrowia lipolytica]RDW26394.1 hypothetical protein B0I71DRAFT_130880 [Yarrowia lipolytica]|eukprot:XP_502545.1 YALI0D07744p [Yarrowia lipolytica CLIB122]